MLCNDCHITLLPCYLKSMYQQRELYMSAKEKLKVTASYKHLLLLNSDTKSTACWVPYTTRNFATTFKKKQLKMVL
ncbi:putative NDP-glucose--starch glucosyltransferase [Helianthus annuus]|uniref:NDP-glucose--starch glucosyltransferase n=1 Tax=Helianthus annuus TaxID=4232 RepID=A0A9K3J6L5_HELAN|nr:putative NDP-glucose--starch glucosyltransferase [Helianthus annuus]KAJ0588355.1 putative NDP-glucose--starch glucosyltransferase [Helianthus annuus]KAJ0930891.1 putative NDP-glucose--starch glucosyltransferase [Helianthus annuus]